MFKEDFKNKNIIAIVGLMGVGKTTIGAKLAEKIGFYFADSDVEIEDCEKKSINEIFLQNGEKYFREVEKNIIQEIVARDEKTVLSLGGGAFMNEVVREMLLKNAITIWLHAPIDVILRRLGKKNNRPLLNNKNKEEVLKDLAKIRYPIYEMANFKVETSMGGHGVVINKILELINDKNKL